MELRVEILERPAEGRWEITYSLSREVPGLRFLRNRNRFRYVRWRPAGSSDDEPRIAGWWNSPAGETLLAEGRSSRFHLQLVTDLEPKPRDHELFVPFSDGGLLLFTGHLAAVPLVCPGDSATCPPEAAIPFAGEIRERWTFRTAPAVQSTSQGALASPPDHRRRVLLADRGSAAGGVWEPSTEEARQGTFVYFGSVEPVRLSSLTTVIDPDMPAWVVERTQAFLPRLFHYYGTLTGVELKFHPLVFVSYRRNDRPEIRFTGGMLGGVLQLAAEGRHWQSEGHVTSAAWLQYLAHEAFHLWNAEMLRFQASPVGEWLSEGSAEYFALMALRDLLGLSDWGFEQRLVGQANRCLIALRGRPLVALHGPGDFDSYYACGTTLQALLEGGLRPEPVAEADPSSGPAPAVAEVEPAPPANLAAVYRRVFQRAAQGDGRYGIQEVVEAYRALGGHQETLDAVEQLLNQGIPRKADVFFAEQLRRAGVEVERVPLDEAPLDTATYIGLVESLLGRCDCGEEVPAQREGSRLRFAPSRRCHAFREGLDITHVEGYSPTRQPSKAWARAVTRLSRHQPVALRTARQDPALLLSCEPESFDASYTSLLRSAAPPPTAGGR